MKIQSSLNRIRTQLSGMERMIRTLRSEIETQILAYAPGEAETMCGCLPLCKENSDLLGM